MEVGEAQVALTEESVEDDEHLVVLGEPAARLVLGGGVGEVERHVDGVDQAPVDPALVVDLVEEGLEGDLGVTLVVGDPRRLEGIEVGDGHTDLDAGLRHAPEAGEQFLGGLRLIGVGIVRRWLVAVVGRPVVAVAAVVVRHVVAAVVGLLGRHVAVVPRTRRREQHQRHHHRSEAPHARSLPFDPVRR